MLHQLREEVCSVCGAPTTEMSVDYREGKIREHANGTRWERRTYACGFRVCYVPNFERASCIFPCPHHPEIKQRREGREKAHAKIVGFIKEIGDEVDADYLHDILEVISELRL